MKQESDKNNQIFFKEKQKLPTGRKILKSLLFLIPIAKYRRKWRRNLNKPLYIQISPCTSPDSGEEKTSNYYDFYELQDNNVFEEELKRSHADLLRRIKDHLVSYLPDEYQKQVSIIIPVYNVEQYIGYCLATVLNQTFKNIEVICIDDCSSDRSFQIISEIAEIDSRVKILRQEKNQGQGIARNLGIRESHGDYLIFIDSDDFIDFNYIEKLYLSATTTNADITSAKVFVRDKTGMIRLATWYEYCKIEKSEYIGESEKINLLYKNSNTGACKHLYKRELLLHHNDISFAEGLVGEDQFFNLCAFYHANKIVLLDEDSPKYYYNTFAGISASPRKEDAMYKKKILDQIDISKKLLYYAKDQCFSQKTLFILLKDTIHINLQKLGLLSSSFKEEYKSQFLAMLDTFIASIIPDDIPSQHIPDSTTEEPPPILSVIVPVYNVENYLVPCLESLADQTLGSIEIICVEDVSTDNSRKILEEYALTHPNIKIIYHDKNKGLSAARNTGILAARAPYVAFVDSDDTVASNMYETMMKFMQESGADVSVCGVDVKYDPDFLFIKNSDDQFFAIDKTKFQKIDKSVLASCNVVAWNKIFKKSIIDQYHLRFPEGLAFEDNSFFWKYFTLAKSVYFINEKFYNYYRRTGSITGNSMVSQQSYIHDRLFIIIDIYNHLEKYHIIHEYADEFFKLSYNIISLVDDLSSSDNKLALSHITASILRNIGIDRFKNEIDGKTYANLTEIIALSNSGKL